MLLAAEAFVASCPCCKTEKQIDETKDWWNSGWNGRSPHLLLDLERECCGALEVRSVNSFTPNVNGKLLALVGTSEVTVGFDVFETRCVFANAAVHIVLVLWLTGRWHCGARAFHAASNAMVPRTI